MNREEWLNKMLKKLIPHFEQNGFQVPQNIRVSVGFPSKGKKSKTIGECWDLEQSDDHHFEIFIRPDQADPVKVAGVLVHEVCHAVVGIKAKHGPEFKECAHKVGLQGKMKATTETDELKEKLEKLISEVGPYPHAMLHFIGKEEEKPSNPTSFKIECKECGYNARISKKWIQVGMPICPCGESMNLEEGMELGEAA